MHHKYRVRASAIVLSLQAARKENYFHYIVPLYYVNSPEF
jgi:hypothetical protein